MADDQHTLQCPFVAGIDPAAETFTAALFASLEEGALEVDTFANTSAGFAAWLAQRSAAIEQTLVCAENTGVYSEALCYDLHERSFALTLIRMIIREMKSVPRCVVSSICIAIA